MNDKLEKWRFLDTGKGNAFFNMALDEALAESLSSGMSGPVLRLYEWERETVTCGYFQNVRDILDIAKCSENRIDFTRRPTGGRAVFHKNEIAYSVIDFTGSPFFGGSIMDSYSSICLTLIDALRRLGIDADYERGIRKTDENSGHSAPCFSSVSRYEITLGGKKIVGSAQRRFKGVFIQQGSILYGPGQEKITDYLIDVPSSLKDNKSDAPVDLSLIIKNFTPQTLKNALFEAFGKRVADYYFTAPEKSEIEKASIFVNERYGSKGWVLGNEK
jgi:lipoate-protein ligase A